MSDLTRTWFDAQIEFARTKLDALSGQVAQHRAEVQGAEQEHDELDAHLRNLMHLRALYAGEVTELTSQDVQSADDVMGIVIGGLSVAPPAEATEADLANYVEVMRHLYDQASHQARLATDVLNARTGHTPPDGVPVVTGPSDAEAMPAIEAPAADDPAAEDAAGAHLLTRVGVCVHCKLPIADHGGGWQHTGTWAGLCYPARPSSPYAQPKDPFEVGPDPEDVNDAGQLTAYRVTFTKLGRKKDVTPLEIRALDDTHHLAKLIAVDAAQILDTFAEEIEIEVEVEGTLTGRILRHDKPGHPKEVGHFTVEEVPGA